jgi:archaeosine synthase
MYPASNYDVPVTGTWTCDERQRVSDSLARYLSANNFESIVAHVSGPYREICDAAAASAGVEVVYTVDDERILSSASLRRLSAVVRELIEEHTHTRRDLRFDYIRDLTDYQFGPHASEAVFPEVPMTRGIFPFYYASDRGRRIATITGKYHTLALTLEGARRYLRASGARYIVEIDDFQPKGTIFAIGVVRADPEIRPFDEVIVCNDQSIAVGRALMSGWEMEGSKNGGAVAVRHAEPR